MRAIRACRLCESDFFSGFPGGFEVAVDEADFASFGSGRLGKAKQDHSGRQAARSSTVQKSFRGCRSGRGFRKCGIEVLPQIFSSFWAAGSLAFVFHHAVQPRGVALCISGFLNQLV